MTLSQEFKKCVYKYLDGEGMTPVGVCLPSLSISFLTDIQ